MKKVLINIFAGALPQIVNIISNLVLPAMIIYSFGSEINGLVSTTKMIIAYVSIVGAGIAAAATQSLYEPVAKVDTERIRGMLKATDKMFVKYGTIFIMISLAISLIYPLIIDSNTKWLTITLLMVVMSLSGASEFFAVGRCRALLYANQQVYVCTIIQAISLLGSLIAAVILINLGFGIVLVQLAISSVYIFRAVLLVGYVNKKYPELKTYKESNIVHDAVKKRGDAMIHQVSGLAITGSQTIILSSLVSLNAASIYAVYNIVFSGLQLISASLSTAITPFLGREYALDNKYRLNRMYDIVEFAFFMFVTFVYSVTVVMIIPFISVYTKEADINYVYESLASLFVGSSAFYILKMPSTALINVAGHFKETRIRAIIEASLCVGLGIIFTILFGLNGVLIGSLVALCWRCFDSIIYSNKHILNSSNMKSLRRLLTVLCTVTAFGIFGYTQNIIVVNFVEWICCAVKISVIAFITVMLESVIFERKTVMNLLRRNIK